MSEILKEGWLSKEGEGKSKLLGKQVKLKSLVWGKKWAILRPGKLELYPEKVILPNFYFLGYQIPSNDFDFICYLLDIFSINFFLFSGINDGSLIGDQFKRRRVGSRTRTFAISQKRSEISDAAQQFHFCDGIE